MTAPVRQGGDDDLPELRELWIEMLHHHRDVVGERVGVLDDETSWASTLEKYREWAAKGELMLLLAQDADGPEARLVGYLVCHVSAETGRTLDLGHPHGTVDSLVVAERARGSGVGTALLDACRHRLRELGGRTWSVGVVVGNDGAQAFYERMGFRPHYLDLLAPLN